MNSTEVEGDRFSVKIEEQECYCGLAEEPSDVDLKLTIKDDEDRVAVIVGMDEEIERLVGAITNALTTKRQREQAEADEEEREYQRQQLPKKVVRIRGDVETALLHLDVSDGIRCEDSESEDEDEVIVELPDDLKTVEDLNWLAEAHGIEWEPFEKSAGTS